MMLQNFGMTCTGNSNCFYFMFQQVTEELSVSEVFPFLVITTEYQWSPWLQPDLPLWCSGKQTCLGIRRMWVQVHVPTDT